MPTDTDSDDESNHYTDLRAVYMALIDEHQEYKSKARDANGKSDDAFAHYAAKRDATVDALVRVEDLLNEWTEHDERDGPPDASE